MNTLVRNCLQVGNKHQFISISSSKIPLNASLSRQRLREPAGECRQQDSSQSSQMLRDDDVCSDSLTGKI